MNPQIAAKYLCESANWTLTQLSVHKGLYIAHMIYLGETGGTPLISECFEAWEYGPVVPSLYHKLKIFGNKPVKESIFWRQSPEENEEKVNILRTTGEHVKNVSAASLVHFTHKPEGAWAMHYVPGSRGKKIPNSDILREYETRSNTPTSNRNFTGREDGFRHA